MRQIFEDMRAYVRLGVWYHLFDHMDDACHILIFVFCLVRLVRREARAPAHNALTALSLRRWARARRLSSSGS